MGGILNGSKSIFKGSYDIVIGIGENLYFFKF